jgi:hypothetical protein
MSLAVSAAEGRTKLGLWDGLREQDVAVEKGADQFVLLSAICVQKPLLTFQAAKLKFEEALMTSGLKYSIVRPTAFFKSLGGQVAPCKVRARQHSCLCCACCPPRARLADMLHNWRVFAGSGADLFMCAKEFD